MSKSVKNKTVKIETLKRGELFKLPTGKIIYEKYERYHTHLKKFECRRYRDVMMWRNFHKGTMVKRVKI